MLPQKQKKTKTSKPKSPSQRAIEEGYRSGLELLNAEHLKAHGVTVVYEDPNSRIKYEVHEIRSYTPDFILPNGVIVETKGRFTSDDRKKHLLIKAQHPLLDIRFVFERSSTRITKASKTTYAMWANKFGFIYADKKIPLEWLR